MRGLLLLIGFIGYVSATPSQLHVTLAGKRSSDGLPDGLVVSWFTQNQEDSVVKYGTTANLSMTATGSSIQYLADYGYHHHVTLPSLAIDSVVYYSAGSSSGGFSPTTRAYTAKSGTASWSVFGDLGADDSDGNGIETFAALKRLFAAGGADATLHVGDVSYADDYFTHHPTSFGYEDVYNSWMTQMSNTSSASHPYLVVPGNHESSCHSPACLFSKSKRDGLGNFTAYNSRFHMPSESSGGVSSMWYSFNYGYSHIVGFDTETDWSEAPEKTKDDSGLLPAGGYAPEGTQLAWFERDLQAANASRARYPWLIVMGHRPIYSMNSVGSDGFPNGQPAKLQAAIEGLLEKYKVDMFIVGHVHAYSRSWPVASNTVHSQSSTSVFNKPAATIHLTVGGAGCDEMKHKQVDVKDASELPWAVFTDKEHYGNGWMHVNQTSLVWQWRASKDDSVLDSMVIHK